MLAATSAPSGATSAAADLAHCREHHEPLNQLTTREPAALVPLHHVGDDGFHVPLMSWRSSASVSGCARDARAAGTAGAALARCPPPCGPAHPSRSGPHRLAASVFTRPFQPQLAAPCSAVWPLRSRALTFAPAASSSFDGFDRLRFGLVAAARVDGSTEPLPAAAISGVMPLSCRQVDVRAVRDAAASSPACRPPSRRAAAASCRW